MYSCPAGICLDSRTYVASLLDYSKWSKANLAYKELIRA